MKLRNFFGFVAMLLSMHATMAQGAAESALAPDKMVENVSQRLLLDISRYRQAIDVVTDEKQKTELLEQFYGRLLDTLEPVVDFNWIALNVMGQYRKQATLEQRRRFRDVFTQSLVETYGRGLLAYSDQKIIVMPLEEPERLKRKVTVTQQIQGVDNTYPLLYSMGRNRDGEWKVINVIINGINLGSTFRNQFMQAADKYRGDLDEVITHWAATKS